MKIILISTALLGLLFAGCNKNDTPPVVQKTENAVGKAYDKTKDAVGTAYDKTKDAVGTAVDKTKDAAVDAKNAVADKFTEWKLTPSDIKADLQKSGRIVRDKTVAVGEKVGGAVDKARIVTVINAKYVADSDLSAWKINVDADNGVVTLNGTVRSVDFIGKAIALALDTDGVHQVVSLLKVETK